jgi:hypothetical protein
MMRSENGRKKNLGLRNVMTFGRSVTFVIQNVRGKDPRFEDWYLKHQDKMNADPVLKFFRDARNNLEKQGRLELGIMAKIRHLGPNEMSALERARPPGAESFFIGDSLGGTGWITKLPDGSELSFYVELPASVGEVEQHFTGDLANKFLGETKQNTYELAEYFLRELSKIVDDASDFFLKQPPAEIYNGKRLPPFLRVVK